MSLRGAYIEDIDVPNYQCDFCGKPFNYKKELEEHQETHKKGTA